MRFVGLVRHEVARLASRRSIVFMLAVFAAWMVFTALDTGTLASTSAGLLPLPAPSRLVGSLSAASGYAFMWVFALGGTVAEDRGTGSLSMILTRAGSRTSWLLSKLAATAVVGAAVVGSLAAVSALAAYSSGDRSFAVFGQTVVTDIPLATASPMLYLFLATTLAWLSVLAFCSLAIVAGLFTRSPFASQALAAAVYGLSLFAGGPNGPSAKAEALSNHVASATLASTATYWVVFITLIMGFGIVVCSVRGEA